MLVMVLIELIYLPWAFGSTRGYTQLGALGLAIPVFILAVLPRTYAGELSDGPAFRISPWRRLLRFPIFWLGLALLGYIAIQGANPSYYREQFPTGHWRLVREDDIPWLPTSIEAPYELHNAWRSLVIYATVWLTACAVWIGVTRRKTLHILLGVLVANACVIGIVGLIHRASGEPKLLWLREFRSAGSFGSFIYRNHAGAFLGLLAFSALGLAVWHFFEGRKKMARSTPSALWLLAAVFLIFAVVLSMSRGATIAVGTLGLAALVAMAVLRLTTTTQSTTPAIVNVLVILVVFGTVGFIVREVDFREVKERFGRLAEMGSNDPSVLSRAQVRESAADMLGDYWLRGVGAGSFSHRFPKYIRSKPLVYQNGRLRWEHAHNDWLQIPIELGLTGVLLLASGMGWIAYRWFRDGGYKHPLAVMLALGAGQTLVHALMDFPLQNPAILVTWCTLLVIGLRWLELDSPPKRTV